MKYQLIREKRRTISLKVEPKGQIVVKAPNRASQAFIDNFIISKQKWIEKQLHKISKVNDFKNSFDFNSKLYILGQVYEFAEVDMALIGASKAEIWKYYYRLAANRLTEMAKQMVDSTGLSYRTIKLSSSRRVWGSFDRNGNMKLNYKLVILPPELIKYVIIHELCHGKHLNHSKEFWQAVEQYCPEFKKCKKELEMYSFLLEI